jgi:hypothetical protein
MRGLRWRFAARSQLYRLASVSNSGAFRVGYLTRRRSYFRSVPGQVRKAYNRSAMQVY